jgi:protein-tyrosine phosphatase
MLSLMSTRLVMDPIKIIFVCLGNYCRSPMAEAIFNTLAEADGRAHLFQVSSAGTKDWDVGLRPDPRAQRLLEEHGYPLSPHKRAQKITQEEIHQADYLIAMTRRVANALGGGENVSLLLDYAEDMPVKDIPDPYPTDTFPEAFSMIEHGVLAFYASWSIPTSTWRNK